MWGPINTYICQPHISKNKQPNGFETDATKGNYSYI